MYRVTYVGKISETHFPKSHHKQGLEKYLNGMFLGIKKSASVKHLRSHHVILNSKCDQGKKRVPDSVKAESA